jgi:DNA polymerase III epsilon subunit family exonuclease
MSLNDNPIRGGSDGLANAVVFDLETTGLSPSNDEIIQIAAVRIDSGKVRASDRFFSYVRPTRRISPFITDLTGITDDDVEDAPPALDVLKQFAAFCGDSLLVAHNGHAFDIPFIRSACDRRRLPVREARYVDSMHLSWLVWGREAGLSHSLDAVLYRLRVGTQGARRHDARGDVTILAKCYLKLVDHLGRTGWPQQPKIYSCALPFESAQDAATPDGVQPTAPLPRRRAGGTTSPGAKNGRNEIESTESIGFECTVCGGDVDEDLIVNVFINPPVKKSTIGKIEVSRTRQRGKKG